jgi:hypothetical protein
MDAFIDNIEVYIGDELLREYKSVIRKPISFGEIMSKLITCDYKDLSAMIEDVDLLVQNCTKFWSIDRGNNGFQFILYLL